MANVNNPTGANPFQTIISAPYDAQGTRYYIPVSDNVDVFVGDVVKLVGTSSANGIPICAQAAAGDKPVGVVVAIEATHLDENNVYRKAGEERFVIVKDDPWIEFEMQANGTVTTADIGKSVDVIVGTGSTSTGLSGMQLDLATLTTDSAQIMLLGIVERSDNEWGEFTKVRCIFSEHKFKAETSSTTTGNHSLLTNLDNDDHLLYARTNLSTSRVSVIGGIPRFIDEVGTLSNVPFQSSLGTNSKSHVNIGENCITGAISGAPAWCTVGGGHSNQAPGEISTVDGGEFNTASGYASKAGGGRFNNAGGDYSSANGRHSNLGAAADHSYAWSGATSPQVEITVPNVYLIFPYGFGSFAVGTTTPDASAIAQADSTTKGWLPPRGTTTQRDNIVSPAEGLIFINITTHTVDYYDGTAWNSLSATTTKAYGEMIMIGNSTGVEATSPTKIAGTTTSGVVSDFTHTNGRLTYNGAATKMFQATLTASWYLISGVQDNASSYVALNGSALTQSRTYTSIEPLSSNTTPTAIASNTLIELSTNDYLEIFVQNWDDTDQIATYDLQFNVVEV